jgi:Protein of unknown function (DUF1553)/Protein of unknown function (DUF1549)
VKSYVSALVAVAVLAGAAAQETAVPPFENHTVAVPQGRVDEFVFGNLKELGIQPARLCSDAVFVRRAFLDVIGTLPTSDEAAEFLASREANKRGALIDRLLERDEFADYQAMKWSDLLRIKAEFPINLWPNAAQAYHRWIRSAIRENRPYDRFVREMLTASGSNFRTPPVNFYRAMQGGVHGKDPQTIARTVALTFMGTRAEQWPKERLADLAVFFSEVGYKETGEWKEEIVFFDPAKSGKNTATFPDGTQTRLDRDPRERFADWLIAPGNLWFARNIVNRVWSWLLGRGIIHEPDDIRPDNPPGNPDLLAYLERELISSKYDLKHIYRLILNSTTYQLSSIPRTDRPGAAAHFAYYPLRRLEAEVLVDALCQITGTGESYTSAIPEPFTVMPENQRAIGLPDGSITSSFLELFGRPPRDTGLESERNNRPSDAQRLHMLNSTHVQRKIEQSPKLQSLIRNNRNPQDLVTQLYLTILSRPPTPEEWKIVAAHSQVAKGRDAVVDLAWALINSAEFLYRH